MNAPLLFTMLILWAWGERGEKSDEEASSDFDSMSDLLFVDDEFRYIGAGVVTAGVELHAGAGGLIGVDVGVDDGLAIPHGLGDIVTIRVDDGAAAIAGGEGQTGDLVRGRTVIIGGIHILGEVLIYMEYVALSLDGNVLDGVVPLGIIVGIGAEIEAHALLIEGHAGKGHIVFPTDESAHSAPRGVHRGEVVAVGIAPDNALSTSGL